MPAETSKHSCARCEKVFTDETMVQIGGSVYCETCADHIEAAKNRKMTIMISSIGACAVLFLAVGTFAWIHHQNRWDNEHRAEILSLKSQAESAQTQGRIKDAAVAYESLFRIVDGHTAQTSELSSAINQARSAYDLLEPDYRKVLAKEAEGKRLAEEQAQKGSEEKRSAAERARRVEEERQAKLKVEQEAAQLTKDREAKATQELTEKRLALAKRQAAWVEETQKDPAGSFRKFISLYFDFDVADEQQISVQKNKEPLKLGDLAFDVKQTNSLVTPIVGTAEYYRYGKYKDNSWFIMAKVNAVFTLKNGNWIPLSAKWFLYSIDDKPSGVVWDRLQDATNFAEQANTKVQNEYVMNRN